VTAGLAITLVLATIVTGLVLGGFSAVVTYGDSMAPGLHPGDLAVVRRQPDYRPGDIVAYRSRSLDITILHRIVHIQDGRVVTRGDNNYWLDPDRPSAAELTGRLALRIPRMGAAVQWLRSPAAIAAVLLIVVALPAGRAARHRRRRRQMPTDPTPASQGPQQRAGHPGGDGHRAAPPHGRPPGGWAGQIARRLPASAAMPLAVAALATAAIWLAPRPAAEPGTDDREPGRVSLAYRASTQAGSAYPSGMVQTGDPIFLRLVHDVTFSTSYTGPEKSPVELAVQLEHPSGWHRAVQLDATASAGTGGGSTAQGTLDLDSLSTVLSGLSFETGLPATGTTVVVASTAGGWVARSTFTFDGVQLHPDLATLTASQPAAGPAADTTPTGVRALLTPLGRLLPSTLLRAATTLGVSAAAVGFLLLHRRRRPGGLPARRVFQVADHTPAAGRTVIDLPEPGNLARLADFDDLPIFESAAGHFFIDDGAVIYRYRPPQACPAELGVFADQLASEIISRIARDFRSPLATIRGYAELLGEAPTASTTGSQRRMLAAIDRGVSRLHGMVDDVTLLAELDRTNGTGDSTTQLIDVAALIGEATAPIAEVLREMRVRLVVEFERNLPRVAGEARRLSWALGEIVRSAASGIGPGGELMLRAAMESRQVALTITGRPDTGSAAAGEPDGSGIARSVAEAVITHHRGTVTCSGSTTTVRLPAV